MFEKLFVAAHIKYFFMFSGKPLAAALLFIAYAASLTAWERCAYIDHRYMTVPIDSLGVKIDDYLHDVGCQKFDLQYEPVAPGGFGRLC